VHLLGNPREVPVDEGVPDRFARVCKRGDFELDLISAPDSGAGHDQFPVKSFYGQVFASRSDVDRMAFPLKGANQLDAVNADGPFRPAMAFCIVMSVTNDA
jgi:hypothetical protein